MSFYSIILLLLLLIFVCTTSSLIKTKSRSFRNASSSLNLRHRISAQAEKVRNYSSVARDRLHHSDPNHDDEENDENAVPTKEQTSVVVLTSLTGIYVWWPILFGGDDSFHLLLTQEDVPRFHDVTGDSHGHIYLTSPHERTVYRLQYSEGWWISNFSNHSVMNSIRSEMPLFLTIHHISSIVYVYGHSDIQVIDLIQRPRTRGSAPFMKRLRELSPSLRISDMVIDQIKSDGYIIGDSYGWCTVILCSLSVNDCQFLFKVPSSYDNRPYLCTGTIDFSKKIMYLSLEDKILAVHLNEQTNYDRREILTEKLGSRSALGYDDIVTQNNVILYTDVLRPLLHICTLINSNPCLNISLIFPSIQRSILPLRLSIIQVSDLRPPVFDDDEDAELHINQTTTTTISSSTEIQRLVVDKPTKSYVHKETRASNIWMLILGICIGLVLAGVSFMVYYVVWNKNRPTCKKDSPERSPNGQTPLLPIPSELKFESLPSSSSSEPATESSSESTTITTSSSSYRPDTIL